MSLIKTCFSSYFIGHLRDSQGYVTTWYDEEKDDGTKKTYTFNPGVVNDTIYATVENYPYQIVSSSCVNNSWAA